jgi:hypothetical protein
MKKLLFLLILVISVFSFNTINAQKISNCTPKVPKNSNNWTVVKNSNVGDGIDFSKINVKLEPVKEGTNLSDNFEKEAQSGFSTCYLEFFLENQQVIPDDWKKAVIVFTGTVFKEDGKYIVYRTIFFNKDEKQWVDGKNYADYILENTYKLVSTK